MARELRQHCSFWFILLFDAYSQSSTEWKRKTGGSAIGQATATKGDEMQIRGNETHHEHQHKNRHRQNKSKGGIPIKSTCLLSLFTILTQIDSLFVW